MLMFINVMTECGCRLIRILHNQNYLVNLIFGNSLKNAIDGILNWQF